jgi:hypothetical protein
MQPKEGKNLDALSIYSGHSMVVEVYYKHLRVPNEYTFSF